MLRNALLEWVNGFRTLWHNVAFYLLPRYPQAHITSNLPPVVLFHGYRDVPLTLSWLVQKLAMRYAGPIYTVHMPSTLRCIKAIGHDIRPQIQAIADQHSQALHLVGYSLGGVVACHFAQEHGKSFNIAQVITISSPLKGSIMTDLAVGTSSRQLAPSSAFLSELATGRRDNPLRHIACTADNVIIPWHSAQLHEAEENLQILYQIPHISLMFSFQTVDAIIRWLPTENTSAVAF